MLESNRSSTANNGCESIKELPDLTYPVRVAYVSLCAYLPDFGLPDLVAHAGRGSRGPFYLDPFTYEDVNLLGSVLTKLYIFVAPTCCFQGCLTRRLSSENAYLVSFGVTQGKVSGFFLFFWYGNPLNTCTFVLL
jgi:hypothetical protein